MCQMNHKYYLYTKTSTFGAIEEMRINLCSSFEVLVIFLITRKISLDVLLVLKNVECITGKRGYPTYLNYFWITSAFGKTTLLTWAAKQLYARVSQMI